MYRICNLWTALKLICCKGLLSPISYLKWDTQKNSAILKHANGDLLKHILMIATYFECNKNVLLSFKIVFKKCYLMVIDIFKDWIKRHTWNYQCILVKKDGIL